MTVAPRPPHAIAVVILAAGGSSRLGRPKQLLPFRGRTLIHHTVEAALGSRCRPVVVVLGADAERIRPELEASDVRVVDNPDWREGMGSSIRAAVSALQDAPERVAALVVLTCDQTAIEPAVIDRLCEAWRSTGQPMIASGYGGTVGVPALFDAALFPRLAALSGARGAKRLLQRGDAAVIPWPAGVRDVDTPEDRDSLRDGDEGP